MSSKRVEGFRRTTKRLLEQERSYQQCKVFLCGCSQVRRVELAAWLLTRLSVELGDECNGSHLAATFSRLGYETLEAQRELLRRVMAGSATGNTSGDAETPAAAPVPSTVPSAAFNGPLTTDH